MTPSQARRDIAAVLKKIPVVYYAAAALALAIASGWQANDAVGEQADLPEQVKALQRKDSVLAARIDSANNVQRSLTQRLTTIDEKQTVTLCFVKALWAGNDKPSCGLE